MKKIAITFAITTIFIISYWNASDSSSKDELFYLMLIGYQIGLFFFAREISKLSAELASLKDKNGS